VTLTEHEIENTKVNRLAPRSICKSLH